MSTTTGIRDDLKDGQPLLRLDDKAWFHRLGHVVKSIGSRDFHHELVDLFGASIRHESCWIIRFSRGALPEVLHTEHVPDQVVGTYTDSYSDIDPFSDYWKNYGRSGVIMLSEAKAESRRTEAYSRVFLPGARISDEMSIFLPTVGQDCYGLFLEREGGHFSRADVERAQRVFPALEGCHRAHLGTLFANVHKSHELEFHGLMKKPILIQDRFGAEVYSNDAWNEAIASDKSLCAKLREPPAGDEPSIFDGWILKSEALRGDFALAPYGRLFVLEPHISSPFGTKDVSLDVCVVAELTPREREVFSFIMRGRTTAQIAQALKTSKGVIKNYKHRIYRKVCVDSERALVRKFASSFLGPDEDA